jgi:hypothetical protein
MAELEKHLLELEAKVTAVAKASDALSAVLRRLKSEVRTGRLSDIDRTLSAVQQRAGEALAEANSARENGGFDVRGHLESGAYLEELKAAADAAGVQLFERDGRIYSFPLLMRIEPREAAVRIGRKLERRLRPKELMKLVSAVQKRPQRFREAQFLELLYKAYQHAVGKMPERGPGPVVALAHLHGILTLLPGADYPIEEFGRDLLLLARQPATRTRDGSRFELAASTISKERVQRIVVYDESGAERLFVGIRFARET